MTALHRRATSITLASILLAAVFLLYWPALSGPFVFDDYPNIVNNSKIAVSDLDYTSLRDAALSRGEGISTRSLALASFAINFYFAELNPYWYKLTNLAIHLLNTILIFCLARILFAAPLKPSPPMQPPTSVWLPMAVAAAWALHPINLDPVLYVVQRMTSLATLFMLIGLLCFVSGRRMLHQSPQRGLALMISGSSMGTLLGLLSKEIALLLPLYLLVLDITIMRRQERAWPTIALRFHAVSIGLVIFLALLYLFAHAERELAAYGARDFTLVERLLTQPRILWFYASLIVFPIPSRFSLFHDDIAVSTGLLSPYSTLFAVAGLGVVLLAGVIARSKYPVASFTILWFLAGHVMESSVIGLEIAHEHRNYLPSFAPLLGIVYGIDIKLRDRRPLFIARISVIATLAIFSLTTLVRANEWKTEDALVQTMAHHHPESPRALTMLANLYAHRHNDPFVAIELYERAVSLAPNDIGARLRALMLTAETRLHVLGNQRSAGKIDDNELLQVLITRTTLLSEGLPQLLSHRALNSNDQEVLVQFSNCLLEAPSICQMIGEEVHTWYVAIIKNNKNGPTIRKHATLTLFQMAIDRKEYGAALRAADLGFENIPNDATFILMRANAFILMKRYDDAETNLRIVSAQPMTKEISETVLELQTILQHHRRQK